MSFGPSIIEETEGLVHVVICEESPLTQLLVGVDKAQSLASRGSTVTGSLLTVYMSTTCRTYVPGNSQTRIDLEPVFLVLKAST